MIPAIDILGGRCVATAAARAAAVILGGVLYEGRIKLAEALAL